jgi:transcriptional regulator with XRE-family HTH domain
MRRTPTARTLLRSIAANVRALRIRQELTQEQLAEAAGLDPTFVQRIERGSTNVGVVALALLGDALEVWPAVLLKRAEPAVRRPGRPRKTSR